MSKRTPKAPPVVDKAVPADVVPGVRMRRQPIFQTEVGATDAMVQMVTRIATAKALGFTLFEIDVTPVRVDAPKADANVVTLDVFRMYFGGDSPAEGEEWKATAEKRRKLVESHVLTVYALVVE